jgi:cholinesterase
MLVGNTNNEGGLYELIARVTPGRPAPPPGSFSSSPMGVMTSRIGCGTHAAARTRRVQGINAWRYLYAGEYPNQNISIPGAWHTAEIGIVFGTSEYLSRRPDTPEESKLGETVRNAWTSFAKDPVNGLLKLGWPLYDGESTSRPDFICTKNESAIC